MILAALSLAPLFVGPTAFLLGILLLFVVVLLVARIVFDLGWYLVAIAAIALGMFWFLGAVSPGPPGLG